MLISYTEEFSQLFASDAQVQQLATGFTWLEGPVYLPGRGLIFSDVRQNKTWCYHNELQIEEDPSDYQNGHCLDREGRLITCSHGKRAVLREENGAWVTLVSHFKGHRLNSPNDICLHPDGSLWFSDPTYGIDKPEEGYGGEMELPGRWVFRIAPDGTLSAPIRDRIKPNGLIFASETKLWLADTGDGRVYQYKVEEDNATCLDSWALTDHDSTAGKTDGLRLDEKGRIWSSAADGVRVLSADGKQLLGRIALPETCANLCFGGEDGKTLFMTATSTLWMIQTLTQALK